MHKLFVLSLILVLVFNCKKQEKEGTVVAEEVVFVSFQDMPKTQEVNSEVDSILKNWIEFQDFESSFNVLYRAANNEDLALAVEDLLEKEVTLRMSEHPEAFDKPQLKSRQRVFRTYLMKLKASIEDRTNVNEPMKQLLTANNAWRNQFNVVVNNKLDTKLLFDEN